MAWTAPTPAEFKDFFDRDFYFAQASDPNNADYIRDKDINRAISDADTHFNSALFGSDAKVTNAFMYLVAFFLIQNIQLSTKGLASQSKFPISSNSVGGVSISFQIPEAYSKDAWLSSLTANGYGMKYLELLLPFLSGNVGVLCGEPLR